MANSAFWNWTGTCQSRFPGMLRALLNVCWQWSNCWSEHGNAPAPASEDARELNNPLRATSGVCGSGTMAKMAGSAAKMHTIQCNAPYTCRKPHFRSLLLSDLAIVFIPEQKMSSLMLCTPWSARRFIALKCKLQNVYRMHISYAVWEVPAVIYFQCLTTLPVLSILGVARLTLSITSVSYHLTSRFCNIH